MQVSSGRYLQSDILPSLGQPGQYSIGPQYSNGYSGLGSVNGWLGSVNGGLGSVNGPLPVLGNNLEGSPGGVGVTDQQRRLAIFKTFTDHGQAAEGPN
jgi:hypothetical protein